MTGGFNDTKTIKTMVGKRIQEAREAVNMSRRKFSDLLNTLENRPVVNERVEEMNPDRLKSWEYGVNPVPLEWFPVLCNALNCDIGYLFGEYPEKTRISADIVSEFGLTKKSVSVLRTVRKYSQTDWLIDAFNSLVSSENFIDLLLYIVKYGTAGAESAELVGRNMPEKYALKDVYQMKIFDIMGSILTSIPSAFEHRKDDRGSYRFYLSAFENPDKNGVVHSLEEIRRDMESNGLRFDSKLFEKEDSNG